MCEKLEGNQNETIENDHSSIEHISLYFLKKFSKSVITSHVT